MQGPVREADDAVAKRIVIAAVSIADVEGTNSLSMRRVANAVQMSPSTLHRFYPNQRHLLSAMMDRALGVAGKDVVDVGAAVAVMGDSSAAQTALEVGGPQARPLISC